MSRRKFDLISRVSHPRLNQSLVTSHNPLADTRYSLFPRSRQAKFFRQQFIRAQPRSVVVNDGDYHEFVQAQPLR